MENPLLPRNLLGFTTRQSVILEFAPAFISVVMAEKLAHTSLLVSEPCGLQNKLMLLNNGVNAYNYLIFPKSSLFYFTLCDYNCNISWDFWWIYCLRLWSFSSSEEFIEGIQLDFIPFHVTYSFVKTFLFTLLLATIPSYHGYFLKRGALTLIKPVPLRLYGPVLQLL